MIARIFWTAFLALALVHYGSAPLAYAGPPAPGATETSDYQQREAQSRDLEQFEGGFQVELFILAVVFVAVVVTLAILLSEPHIHTGPHRQ
jgi:hypothetical protein